MISFECDYNNGAHPKVIQHLLETNDMQSLTYGFDEWSDRAKESIRKACETPQADIFFLTGGTQANTTIIDSMLMTCEAVISAESGHINVHEAGAVEAFGHRIIPLHAENGKITAKTLDNYMQWFINDESREHLAQPGLVYLTFPTEYGTIYSSDEMEEIYRTCQQYGLPLFIDGARLGYGLMSLKSDITLPWLARHCDVFYIDSPTNQQFVVIPNERMHRLEQHVQFTHWEPFDEQSMVCRFVTSWATTDEDLMTLKRILEEIR